MAAKIRRVCSPSLLFLTAFFGAIACSQMNTAGGAGTVKISPQGTASGGSELALQGWLYLPAPDPEAISADSSQDTGRIFMKFIVHNFSPDEDIKLLRRSKENGDAGLYDAAFLKTVRATVEYPRGGGLRERFAFALEMPADGARRIILLSKGSINTTQKCWAGKIIDLILNAEGEGQGFSYEGGVFFTAGGSLDIDQRLGFGSPMTTTIPRRILNVRPLKDALSVR